jgi:hypothetical protein
MIDLYHYSLLSIFLVGLAVGPTAGFIKVSEQPMIDTAASMAAFAD